ncbi:hypothetical protein QFZ63_001569 [Streptomyces sp. B3I7]|jgi:hypothetical protein|uniref:hypothetical protein n=1 Tax=Streptomyces sp. B3I7 TaxID=3042269 RepID=UPI0027867EB3|nr:hypothetical protein [Streptomyces sp. B3I7]MDQ0809855.1 hypothetical protein [Streptomyces sp. B3I7]
MGRFSPAAQRHIAAATEAKARGDRREMFSQLSQLVLTGTDEDAAKVMFAGVKASKKRR